jgi:hypothetical protein
MYKNTTIMQKNVFLFLALLFNTALSYAQDFEWSTSGGYVGITNSYNGAFDMARDKNGNIFLFNDANLKPHAYICLQIRHSRSIAVGQGHWGLF